MIDPEVVEDYAEYYAAGVAMPPLTVFFDGVDYWLTDGFHRWRGARKAELVKVACDVHQGSLQEARWYSYSANKANGARRTNADKERAVRAALLHPKAAGLSNAQIAEHCGVSETMVWNYRQEMESTSQIEKSSARTGRDGRTIDTSRIGRSRSASKALTGVHEARDEEVCLGNAEDEKPARQELEDEDDHEAGCNNRQQPDYSPPPPEPLLLPHDPTKGQVLETIRWAGQRKEVPFYEKFAALWHEGDVDGWAAARAYILDAVDPA
jgi:hypothetical protein